MTTQEQLQKINNEIRDAEWNRDNKLLECRLSKDLIFRRANGDIIDKETYLNALADKNNTYTHLENLAVSTGINKEENKAIVIVMVKAAGTMGTEHKPFSGIFKNIRFFCKHMEWELCSWYNEKTDDANKDIDDFLLRDYELKVGYMKDQLGRMWTRFNIFVSIESALVGGKFLYLADTADLPFALLGTLFSISWYIFGASDKYLVEVYRAAIREAAQILKASFPAQHIYSLFNYNYVGNVDAEFEYKLDKDIEFSPLSWRIKFLSITHLAALFPLLLTISWLFYLLYLLKLK